MSSEDRTAEPVEWNEPPPDVEWNDWGPPRRVRIEHAPVMLFARAVKSADPVYASEDAACTAGFDRVPVPPTYTFVMTHSGAFPDLQTGEPPPPVDWGALTRGGLYLHGEQHFTYHRQVQAGSASVAPRSAGGHVVPDALDRPRGGAGRRRADRLAVLP